MLRYTVSRKEDTKSLLPEDVRGLYNRLAKGDFRECGRPIAPTTIASVHIAFRAALTDAVEDGLIPRNIVKLASPPIVVPRKVKALDEAQIQVLLRAVKDHRLYAAVVLALGSGARKGEVFGLTWANVSFEEKAITISRQLLSTNHGVRLQEYTKTKK